MKQICQVQIVLNKTITLLNIFFGGGLLHQKYDYNDSVSNDTDIADATANVGYPAHLPTPQEHHPVDLLWLARHSLFWERTSSYVALRVLMWTYVALR